MFTSLGSAKIISIDVETCDPTIKTLGPGHYRGGFVAGIAIGTDDGYNQYLPIAHEQGENLDKEKVIAYLNEELSRAHQPKLGTNILYDFMYLTETLHINIQGELYDVQIAQALLDESMAFYGLGHISRVYNRDVGKHEQYLYDLLAAEFGGEPTRAKQASRIWRASGSDVAPYAHSDVSLPQIIFKQQRKQLIEENLWDLFLLETKLLRVIAAMHHRGVNIDIGKLDDITHQIKLQKEQLELQIKTVLGDINLASPAQLRIALTKNGLALDAKKTKKGAISTSKLALKAANSDITDKVLEWRKLNTLINNYLEGNLRNYPINGRIHCFLHSMKNDDGGTVTGRFSCSHPNLQSIPKRDQQLGGLIRQFFIPDEDELWVSNDWSQIEYRLLVHYAKGASAQAAQKSYCDSPDTDYHQYTHQLVTDMTGIELTRAQIKNINFGLVYGMGTKKLAEMLGITFEHAQKLKDAYHQALPYAADTARTADQLARRRGYVKTILNRRRRFNLYVPSDYEQAATALPLEEAQEKYGMVKRAYTHKALNAVLQGSSADITKKSLLMIWESGVCDVVGAPLITVHDEINFSVPQTKLGLEAEQEIKNMMETCVTLRVPILVSSKKGKNWGEVE